MLPVIAIVGRPNVGKSTLFNCLTRSRNALVADEPGLTRDRRFGVSRAGERAFMAVDTGGLGEEVDEMAHLVAEQAWRALAEADVALLVVDARTGLTPADEVVAARLRSSHLPVVVAVNKAEGLDPALAEAEFHALGLGQPQAIAARHGYGIQALVQVLLAHCPAPGPEEGTGQTGIRVAVVGRPNVGKSTLVNRILGHERVLTHDRPGTTRDSVYIPFERDGCHYTLIDTAGIRRRARVADTSEKFSVVQSLQAIEATEVAIVLMDAHEGVTDQDAHLVGMVLDAGRAIVMALNKWDGLSPERRRHARQSVERKLEFAPFARVHFISALHGTGVGDLFGSIDRAWQSASRDLSTPELSRVLEAAVERHAPPAVRGRRIKLRYAHQGGRNPPLIVIHGTRTALVPDAYRRYLERTFQRALGLEGTPVRVELRTGANPYRASKPAGKRESRRRGTH